MRKRTILLLLALMSALNCFASYVYDTVYVSTINYRIISESDRTAAVTYRRNYQTHDTIQVFEYEGDIVIPSTVFIDSVEYRVTGIDGWAFAGYDEMGCTKLTSITIPEGITYIGQGAFAGCSRLKSLYIPASVTCIGERVIAGCKLDSIKVAMGNSVYDSRNDCNAIIETESNTIIAGCTNTIIPESVESIGELAFVSCRGLTSVALPNTLLSIGGMAFFGCKDLVSINIPESVDSIGYEIVGMCPNLSSITVDINNPVYDSREDCNAIIETRTGDLIVGCNNTIIPSGVKSIWPGAFDGSGITSIVIPEGVTEIKSGTFNNCTNLLSVELPSSVTFIRSCAFQECRSLTSIELPSSLTSIGDNAFQGCSSLNSIELPSNLMYIGYRAFENCRSISSITIPKGVIGIGLNSFSNCVGLTSITILFELNNPDAVYNPFLSGINYDSCSLYIPDGYYVAYQRLFGAFYVNRENVHIIKNPDCITMDGINYCIVSSDDKTVRVVHGDYSGDIVIPSSVKIDGTDYAVVSISNEAFVNSDQMKSIVINEGVTSIGEYAFFECDSLTSVILPSSVVEIKRNALYMCRALTSFTIPRGIKTIESELFGGCVALKHIDIPSSIDYIGDGAFKWCGALETISIPEGIKIINGSTFEGCSSLTGISIPSGVDSIGNYAFSGCKSLESIIVPEGVRAICDGTFSGCESLSYLSLPASVKTFGKNVFDDCYALKSAGPKGGGYNYEYSWDDTIPGSAFNGMKSLRSVYIPKYIKVINDQGIAYKDVVINNNRSALRSLFKACYFEGCDSLESLTMSFSDTKIIRKRHADAQYKWEYPADYYIYVGTPIHSITILDDTIKSLSTYEYGVIDSNIDEVVVSEHVKEIYPRVFDQVCKIKNIMVEPGNSAYSSIDGVLYDNIGRELITYPSAREEINCQIPETVIRIADYAFSGAKHLQSVNIPQSVAYIGSNSFEDCESLKTVTIKGAPQINYNAFKNCPNIEAVYSYYGLPRNMFVFDSPQAITVDGYDVRISDQNMCCDLFMTETGERFFKVYNDGRWDWECDFVTDKIPAGKYRLSIGILPNLTYERPNSIHPSVIGISDSTDIVLYNRVDTTIINFDGWIIKMPEPQIITNNISGYDSVLVVDTLTIPEGFDRIKITLSSNVEEFLMGKYTYQLWLDGIFFEPLDDVPVEMYSGPFMGEVFNNATLYIPRIAVDSYREAAGWKLFKNIAFDPDIEAGLKHTAAKEKKDDVIYDLLGRRVMSKTFDQLEPGVYIIHGSKILVK